MECFFGWFSSALTTIFLRQLLAPPIVTLGFGWRAEPHPAGRSLPVGRCAPGGFSTKFPGCDIGYHWLLTTRLPTKSLEWKTHLTKQETSHQNSSILAHRTSDRVDFPSCRTYQHLLPSCPKTVGLSHRPKPPTASRDNSMGKTTRNCWMKRLCELFMCSTYETGKRLSINHYVKPTKRVMFFQSPQNFGKHFHRKPAVIRIIPLNLCCKCCGTCGIKRVEHLGIATVHMGSNPCADHRSHKSDKNTGVVKPCQAGTILRCSCFRNNTRVLDTNTNNLEN